MNKVFIRGALILIGLHQLALARDRYKRHHIAPLGIAEIPKDIGDLENLKEYKSYQFGDVIMTVAKGDITNMRVDAIVNAANPQLQWGGGVCGAIFRSAGKQNLQKEVKTVLKGKSSIRVGQARVTPIPTTDEAGLPTINNEKLQVQYVVHAVGPNCNIEEEYKKRKQLLCDAYKNSLLEADKVGVESIAFPAISAAIYACPIDESTEWAIDTMLKTVKRTHMKHIFCVFLPQDTSGGYDLYTAYLDKNFTE